MLKIVYQYVMDFPQQMVRTIGLKISTLTHYVNSRTIALLRSSKRPRSKRTRRPSAAAAGLQKRAKTVTSETDLESLSDSKSPMPASLSGKQPYFLEFESFREPLADDPLANPVDRHNSKERHRRFVKLPLSPRSPFLFNWSNTLES